MKEFINEVLFYRDNFISIKLGYNDKVKIREAAFVALNVKNMFELIDKLEGSAFLENFSKKINGIIAIEKHLNLKIINWKEINPKNFQPKVKLKGVLYDVINCGNGNLPLIEKNNKRPAIITVAMSEDQIMICGVASVDILNKYQNDKLVGGLLNGRNRTAFVGFKYLTQLETAL